MKLFTNKTEANLAHIKWASARIRVMGALGNFRLNQSNFSNPKSGEIGSQRELESDSKLHEIEKEKRIILEDLASNSFGQNSNFENIVSLAKTAIIGVMFFIAFVPIMKIKYFLWDLPFKKWG